MKKLSTLRAFAFQLLVIQAALLIATQAGAQHSYTTLGDPYTQDFNDLISSGTQAVTGGDLNNMSAGLNGWYFLESGTNANTTIITGTGSGNAGDTYSIGAASNSDRKLGGLLSGSLTPSFGFYMTNNTGGTITAIEISYRGETWRVGTASRSDRLDFQYSTDATSLGTGTWTNFDALDYANPGQPALGNGAVQHFANINATIGSLSIANGGTFFIRWNDFNASGGDDLMGVDDLTLTATGVAGTDTSVQFASTTSSANEGDGTTDLVLQITNWDASNATEVTITATGATGRITTYCGTVEFPANDGGDQICTVTLDDNLLCDGDEDVIFEITGITGGQGTPFIGVNSIHTLTVQDNESFGPAPLAQAASGIDETEFTANWDAVVGATGYFLNVYTLGTVVTDDFSDGDFTADPVWAGSTGDYAVLTDAALPGGVATTDGFFLGSNASVGQSALYTASDATTEWRFSWGSTTFDPSTTNHFGVVLMADAPFTSIADAFNGYYLRIGLNGATDLIELWRSDGLTKTDLGDFPSSANYGIGALQNGIDVLVTRSPSGEFELFYSSGFTYPGDPVTSAGTLTDNTHGSSSYFGVYTAFANPATSRRVYLDNVVVGTPSVPVPGITSPVAGTSQLVTGLDPNTTYYYVVSAEGGPCPPSANSNEIEVTTLPSSVPELFSSESVLDFGYVLVNSNSASLSFEVSGINLDPAAGDIGVTAPLFSEFELSLDEVIWDVALDLPYAGGTLDPVTVYVRFSPTSLGPASGDITIIGGGAADVLVAVSGSGADAQIYWNFDTATPTIDVIPGISTSDISRGNTVGTTALIDVAVSSTGYTGASGGANATTTIVAGAMDAATSSYFEWTHTPGSGLAVAITDIVFGSRRTATGPTAYTIRSSADGYTSNVGTGTFPTAGAWAQYTHSGLGITGQVDAPLTFRIYGHDGTGATGAANWRIDDLDLLGITVPANSVYWSRATGNVNQPIWSDTPTGDPGPAVFNAGVGMVVQTGDVVMINSDTQVDDLTVEIGATLTLAADRSLTVNGDGATIDGSASGAVDSELRIAGTGAFALSTAATLDLFDLTVDRDGTTTVSGVVRLTGTLQLNDGVFDATGADVRLRSTATHTGRLALSSLGAPLASYEGLIRCSRRMPIGETNWRLLGSPVIGATVAQWDDDFITAGFPGSDYPAFDSPVGSGILWPSIRTYEESNTGDDLLEGLVGVENVSTPLEGGQGFAVWAGNGDQGNAPFTVSVTGEPRIAWTPFELPMSWTESAPPAPAVDGWNLVSNPLPSPIDFDLLSRGADVENGYYIYDPETGNNAYWDGALDESFPAGLLNGIIQSSQGFWLKANGGDMTTTVDESAKVAGNEGGLFGLGLPLEGMLRLRIASELNDFHDETAVYFAEGSPAYGPGDAMKLHFGHLEAPRIATRSSDGHDLLLNRYGPHDEAITIVVTVRAGVAGEYTITADLEGLEGLSCLTLEDLVTGAITPISAGAAYSFEQEATGQEAIARFLLHATAPIDITQNDALCAGTATGEAGLVLGGITTDVTWSAADGGVLLQQTGVSGEALISGLSAGHYSVAVDGGACGQMTYDFIIAEPFVLEATVEALDATCSNTADGVLSVEVLGGTMPYDHLWSNGEVSAAIMAVAGMYSVAITDANGCVLMLEDLTIEAMEESPEALFTPSATTVLVNEPVDFMDESSNADAWHWDFGDGSTSNAQHATHAFALPGTYGVILTVWAGDCEASHSTDIDVQLSTGIADLTAHDLNVWTNGQELVVDHVFTHGGTVHIEVLDATGRLHLQQHTPAHPARVLIPASTLTTGIWFVRITSLGEQRTFRVPLVR